MHSTGAKQNGTPKSGARGPRGPRRSPFADIWMMNGLSRKSVCANNWDTGWVGPVFSFA